MFDVWQGFEASINAHTQMCAHTLADHIIHLEIQESVPAIDSSQK